MLGKEDVNESDIDEMLDEYYRYVPDLKFTIRIYPLEMFPKILSLTDQCANALKIIKSAVAIYPINC